MFLVIVNESFGYTHEQTLDSPLSILVSMLREHGYLINERNKVYSRDDEELEENEEWVYKTDFVTGKKKKIKRVKSI